MKSLKKLIVLLIAVATVLSMVCGSFSAAADDINYGTFDGGMIPDKAIPYYGLITDGKGFPNNDFEQGLMYWGHLFGKRDPKTIAKIVKESDGNNCLQFAAETAWDGLYSVCFTESRIKVGDSPSLLFKYSGTPDIQIVLMQECMNTAKNTRAEVRLAFRLKTIIKAESDDGWNIAVLEPNEAVVTPTDKGKQYDDPTLYFNYFVQIASDASCNTKIDDLQIVNYDTTSGIIKDLDGKQLYDLNALDPPDDDTSVDGGDTTGDDGSTANVSDAVKTLDTYTPDELIVMDGDSPTDDDKSSEKDSSKDGNGNSSKNYIWIIVAAGVVVILGAGAGIFFVIKAKKKPSTPDETPTEENIEE